MIPYEVTHLKNIPDPIGYDQFGRPVRRDISPIVSMFTSMFMHGSFMHLFGNMLFLWIFGNNIEDHLGIGKFIIFYLLAGIAAGIVHILFNFNSLTPVIGASGAVSGVMGAYLVLYPNARIKTLVFLFIFVSFIDIPAKIFLIIWFVYQFLYAGGSSGIAWLAHVGGFLAGMVLVKILQNKKPTHYEIIQ
jgi:membrane associated rhomboid family serine protease